MGLKIFNVEEEFINAALKEIKKSLSKEKEHTNTIALSGGTSPRLVYEALAKMDKIDFSKIEFYQVDERYVDKNDENSNYKMIYESLIEPIKEDLKSFHFFDTSLDIEKSLKKYENDLKKIANLEMDLIILGMGDDGHTASLFPNTKALQSKNNVAHVVQDKFQIKDRLTITFRVIMRAKKLILLLKGKEKEKTLNKLINENLKIKDFPASKLLQHKNLIILFCKD